MAHTSASETNHETRQDKPAASGHLLKQWRSVQAPTDHQTQEGIAKRYERCHVVVVLSIAMSAGRKFVENTLRSPLAAILLA